MDLKLHTYSATLV